VDYVAGDIVAITKRLKAISAGEASIQNSDLDIAAGRDLDFLARECCLYRNVEGVGVCRDFAHLSIKLCRCMNIPACYSTISAISACRRFPVIEF
jgi:hypothetical protein